MDNAQQEVMKEVWAQYDPTMRKRLPLETLRHIFLDLGRDVSDRDLNAVTKGAKEASYDALLDFLQALPKPQASAQDIQASAVVISNFSSFGDRLRTAELRATLATQGDKLTMEELASLVTDADDGYGFVNIENFSQLICNSEALPPRY